MDKLSGNPGPIATMQVLFALNATWVEPNALSALLLRMSPDVAVLAATLGFCLIAVELNRPGSIVPGSLGLVFLLLAAAALGHHPLRPIALCLLALAVSVLALNLWKRLPLAPLAAAGVAMAVGLRKLVPGSGAEGVSLPIAVLCGGAIGVSAALLSRVAFRARRLKAVH